MPERQTSSGTVGSGGSELDEATADGSAAAETAPTERPADEQPPPAAPSSAAEAPTAPARAAHDVAAGRRRLRPRPCTPPVLPPRSPWPRTFRRPPRPRHSCPAGPVPRSACPRSAPHRRARRRSHRGDPAQRHRRRVGGRRPGRGGRRQVTDVIAHEALTAQSPAPQSPAPQSRAPQSRAPQAPAGQPPAPQPPAPQPPAGGPPAPNARVGGAPGTASGGDEPPTELIPVVGPPSSPRRRRALLLTAAAVVGLLVLLYAVDLVSSSDSVPRGVTVAGQEIGGLSHAEAEQRVRAAVEPRTTQPVAVAVGDVTSEIDPKTAGLTIDWPGTVDRAGSQPLNPITRVRSFFTIREVGVATVVDEEALDTALQQLAPVVNKPPAEGTVRFEGVTPVPVPPVDGQELDLAGARQTLERDWTSGERVNLPTTVLPPTTTQDDVTKALEEIATPAVSGPVIVKGEDVTGTISPEVIASALSFRADPNQGLVPELNKEVVEKAVDPQLASSEQPGRDATLSFAGGRPVVTPSQDGRGVDYEATLKDLLAVLTKTGDERKITAIYAAQPAKLTTKELNGLGIVGVIGEFTTGGFAQDSGRNIRRAAEVINGMIVKPGGDVQPERRHRAAQRVQRLRRGRHHLRRHASRGVGGGVSQVATTLYNAAYFAGMTDVTHKPHSFYIGRYPPGREATVFEGAIDMKFRNDLPTGVMIQTAWTPTSLTVRLYGTKGTT